MTFIERQSNLEELLLDSSEFSKSQSEDFLRILATNRNSSSLKKLSISRYYNSIN